MTAQIITIAIGSFLIALGFLVKSYPNLIAGYNTLPEEQKKNVDIESLSTLIRNGLILIGASVIGGYFLLSLMGFTHIANSIVIVGILVGVGTMAVKAQRYNVSSRKQNWLIYLLLGITFLIVLGIIGYGFIPSKVVYSPSSVKFTGMYGTEIKSDDILKVELVSNIPDIKLRVNGFSFGGVSKGIFMVEEWGKTRLLVHQFSAPFIVITRHNGEKLIINFSDKANTEQVYSDISKIVHR